MDCNDSEYKNNDSFEYIVKDSKVVLIRYLGQELKVIVPNRIDNMKVITIAYRCFSYSDIKEVYIPGTIKNIGIGCFADCPNLEKVVCNEGVTRLLGRCFSNCPNLKEVKLPNSLEDIGGSCFDRSGIEQIIIPGKVKTIYSWCFAGCSELKKIVFKSNEIEISSDCFSKCCNLKSIVGIDRFKIYQGFYSPLDRYNASFPLIE